MPMCDSFFHFYLYWETTKTVARETAKTAACVFSELHFYFYWETTKIVARDTAKTAACVQKGFITFITCIIVFIDFM